MYTKGEWSLELRPSENVRRVVVKRGNWRDSIADVFGTNAEDEANAHLIAAAPEMYEALKTISAFYSDTGYRNVMPSMVEAVRKINRAIAKAEGK